VDVRIVQSGWSNELKSALAADHSVLRIASPFIKKGAVESLFERHQPEKLRVITRFNLDHFSEGISDTSALRLLLELGAQIRGVKRLHAKAYLFGTQCAVVSSANLTEAGLGKNHELGVVAEGGPLPARCLDYFSDLWDGAAPDLLAGQLDAWEKRIASYHAQGGPSHAPGLGDEGVDLESAAPEPPLPPWFEEPRQGFVKFFGEGHRRAPRDVPIFDEVDGAGCHWACTYPLGKRPRAPQEGALMFMGRLVHSPNDTKIYGRAIAMSHEPGRDDASKEDIERRPWKAQWPHYIRVHSAEFLSGPLENGVSLAQLMDTLGSQAFGSTAENAARGHGNTNPRRAIRQAPAARLSAIGLHWLNEQLELAFLEAGKLSPAQLTSLDWPST
jgi:PLD-like domain